MPTGFRARVWTAQKNALARPPPQTVLAALYRWNYAHAYTLPHAHVRHQLEKSCLLG